MNFFKTFIFCVLGVVFFAFASADFSSTSFTLENPINIVEGGQSSSSSFQYFSTTSQLVQGQNTSSSFAQNAGFMYFPTATSPVLSAVPGDTQVGLTWTAATGILANITSYSVGVSTSSGGTFIYTSVGNVLASTQTSLTNGTTYYFKVRSFAGGLLLSESAVVSATPVASGGGGGGGGGSSGSGGGDTATIVNFSGRAYPRSTVTLLKDAQVSASAVADSNASFYFSISGLSAGNYIFSLYSEDSRGRRSSSLSFPVSVTAGATTNIGGIFIAPTIDTDKTEVKRGDNITILGQSSPTSEITITINSHQEFFNKVNSDAGGAYLLNFDTSILEMEQHHTKSKAAKQGEISSYGPTVAFVVGDRNVLRGVSQTCDGKADLNTDCRVNLVDFSIASFWYKRSLSAEFSIREKTHLNGDGKIDLVDFSIMAYYWTG